MSWQSKRRVRPEPSGLWLIKYTGTVGPVEEFYATKQQARDRFFTLRGAIGIGSVELRDPAGKLWFRDHYFERGTDGKI